jgi:hypothetical protein
MPWMGFRDNAVTAMCLRRRESVCASALAFTPNAAETRPKSTERDTQPLDPRPSVPTPNAHRVFPQEEIIWANIVSPHETRTRTPDGRDLLFLSGSAELPEFYQGTGSLWRQDELWILIGPIWRRVDSVSPMVALATISNEGNANNAGWSAWDARWSTHKERILLKATVAVRDGDGYLPRVNYQATALGVLKKDRAS